MEIGLGSLVVHSANNGGVIMLVAAEAGDEMYCVSTDKQKSVKQWCHKSALKRVQRSQ